MNTINNQHIRNIYPLITPELLQSQIPLSEEEYQFIEAARQAVADIIQGRDQRLLVVVGPCSVHDEKAVLEYAQRLQPIAEQHRDALHIVMRVYFEKPRTTVGWKGFIHDPNLDGSGDMNLGLQRARQLLATLAKMKMPAATEFLDTITPQYIADLISWAAIGARTTESQVHRHLASGLSMPVGFKNATTGDTNVAINAVLAASSPQRFFGVTQHGQAAIVQTEGNPDVHVVLRGGSNGPNYDAETVKAVTANCQAEKITTRLMIDCSHGNSGKDHCQQSKVLAAVVKQRQAGQAALVAVMLESFLQPGKQVINTLDQLTYGQSITDACIGWEETEQLLQQLAEGVREMQQDPQSVEGGA